MRYFPHAARLFAAVLALNAVSPALAQTVLPVAPHAQALDRCNKMVVARPAEAAAAAQEALGATGTTPDPTAVPGMADGALWFSSVFDFYTLAGAMALKPAIAAPPQV